MADDVQAKFGADTKGLEDGARRAQGALRDVQSTASSVNDTLKNMLAGFGVAFTFDKFLEFTGAMATLGEQTLKTSATLGIATEEVGLLRFMAEATGGSADSLVRTLTRMSTNLTDVSGKVTPTGAAVKALGLDLKELAGSPLPDMLEKLRDRINELPPGLERTAVLQNLARNGAESLLPVLTLSQQQWENLRSEYTKTGAAMSGPLAAAFDETDDKIDVMQQALLGFGIRVFTVLKPAIDATIDGITGFIESMDERAVATALKAIADTALNIFKTITAVAIQAAKIINEAFLKIQQLTAFAEGWNNSGVSGMGPLDGVASIGAKVLGAVDAMNKAEAKFTVGLVQLNADAKKQLDESEAMFASWSRTINGFIDSSTGQSNDPNNKDNWLSPPGANNGKKPEMPSWFEGLDLGGGKGAEEALAATQAALDGQLDLVRGAFEQKRQILEADLENGKLTQQQYTEAMKANLAEQYAAEKALLEQQLELDGLKLSERQNILNQLLLLEQQYAGDILKINQKAAAESKKAWQSAFDMLGNAISAQVGALVNGTQTIADALLAIGGDIATQLIQQAIKAITALAAQAFAGVFAHDAPTLGLGAAATAAAGQAAVMAGAGALASLDVGSWRLPGDTIAKVHKDEMIVPAAGGFADQMRDALAGKGGGDGGLGGGGGDTHHHYHGALMDAESITRAVVRTQERNRDLRGTW